MEFVPGEIGLLNPGQAHEDFASTHLRDYVTVFLSTEFVLNLLSESGYSPAAAPDFPTAKLNAGPNLARIGDQLRNELSEEQFGRDTVLDGLVAEMAILLFRCFHLAHAEHDCCQNSGVLRPEVRRALEFLHDNYTRRFSLDLLASAVGVSKYHLDRMFKKGMGIQPRAYVHSLRVEAAKRQLTGSAKPLIEIALELGFADQSHFSNVFKQMTGVSPQVFRTNQ
jgi:AraC-like DNA-binding protein